ncbi:DNA methyltransferase [Chromatium okenii]|jgi:adenine specific DNA methylase Mod|uniref:Site-specific DNA-methyltransferase n=1 Tax=Chromatium okenii TaxID=61644 RepID=A0A2S7XPE8_9GAMM|nr:DNA methyltransferase [Chromatium okenii]PQJ95609.1 site-specific DNA-methyltransferase [Chromatium okenii]
MNTLYFGDNLNILREHLETESVDLIYLDPPFNSNANYNVLFKSPKSHDSHAQIEAFTDTWHWGEQAEHEMADILLQSNANVTELLGAMRKLLGSNDMMAYLIMMASRLLELHRVLKPTGSLYLHCDPTASHYLKILLDAVFGKGNFRTEISWKRSSAHSDAKQGRKQYGNIRDVIYFYTKSNEWTWNWLFTPYSEDYLKRSYRHIEAETGRVYRLDNLTGPGGAATGHPSYEVMGVIRCWRYSKENMDQLIAQGRIVQTKPNTVPAYKRYLDEMPGVPLQNNWDDINPAGGERLGYPTQKPLALLERIIRASSNEGDVILDPFCGCGTAIHAAHGLNRQWIGIDITHLAITLIEKRLRDSFPSITFDVQGTPKDLEGARNLAARDKYQFQWWACSLVNAQPFQGKKKGADGGIDGLIFFQDDKQSVNKIVVSVKGGENVSVAMIRDLAHVVTREQAAIGLFITLAPPTKPMLIEATGTGFYETPAFSDQRYPRLQILTIEGLLNGSERPRYPDLAAGGLNFKKAALASKNDSQKALF